jgi:hypothetical protein
VKSLPSIFCINIAAGIVLSQVMGTVEVSGQFF